MLVRRAELRAQRGRQVEVVRHHLDGLAVALAQIGDRLVELGSSLFGRTRVRDLTERAVHEADQVDRRAQESL